MLVFLFITDLTFPRKKYFLFASSFDFACLFVQIKTTEEITIINFFSYYSCVCVCVCMCVYVCLSPLVFPSEGLRTRALSSEFKNDQANFTDWMSFVSSNLME